MTSGPQPAPSRADPGRVGAGPVFGRDMASPRRDTSEAGKRPQGAVREQPATEGAGPVVYYFGVGAIRSVGAGLDRVVRLHWNELAGGAQDVEGFVVDPTASDADVSESGRGGRLRVYPPAGEGTGRLGRLALRLMSLARPQALQIALSLWSRAAKRDALALARARPPDVLIVDHVYAVQNVPLRWLIARRPPVVFVSHDNTPELLRDLNRDARGPARRLLSLVDYVKALVLEPLCLARADSIVFLSDHDRDGYARHLGKSVALLPLEPQATEAAPAEPATEAGPRAPYVIFVGSPSFLPNGYAIQWICEALAPALLEAAPSCSILLVGKGTQAIAGAGPNVVGEGFVDDDRLAALLAGAIALLAPIEHGGGLKIKILDALSAGLPVIATKRALRGFGAFDSTITIDTAEPGQAAQTIKRFVEDPGAQKAVRARVVDQVRAYRTNREGRIVDLVRRLAYGAPRRG